MFWKRRKDSEAVSVKDQEDGNPQVAFNVDSIGSENENKNTPVSSSSDGVKEQTPIPLAFRMSLRSSRSSSASMSSLSELNTNQSPENSSPKSESKAEVENTNRIRSPRAEENSKRLIVYKSFILLLRSEEHFVQLMKAISTLFISGSESLPESHIPRVYTNNIFKDIPRLLEKHSSLLKALEETCGNMNQVLFELSLSGSGAIMSNNELQKSSSRESIQRRNTISSVREAKAQSSSTNQFPLEKILVVFSQQVDELLDAHMPYLDNISESILCLAECIQKFPKFNTFLEKTSRAKQCLGNDISQLLTSPIERVLRLQDLFGQLLSGLPESDGNSNNPSRSRSIASQIITSIQRWMEFADFRRKSESALDLAQLYRIQRKIIFPEGKAEVLLRPNRKLVREGLLTLVLDKDAKEKQPVYAFLLSDVLIYTKVHDILGLASRPRSNSLKDTLSLFAGFTTATPTIRKSSTKPTNVGLSSSGNTETQNENKGHFYKLVGQITLEQALVVGLHKVKNIKHGFQISTASNRFTFEAPSLTEKKKWIADLDALAAAKNEEGPLEYSTPKSSSESNALSPGKVIDRKLTDRELQVLLTNCTEVQYKKGDSVNLTPGALYRIKSGTLRIDTTTVDGRPITLSRVEADRLFAGSSLSESTPIAESDLVLLKLQVSFMKKLFAVEPIVGMKFYKQLSYDYFTRIRSLPPSLKAAIIGETKNQSITTFNMNMKEGINYFITNCVQNKPTDEQATELAAFLKENHSSLDKSKIGEYLGDGNEKHPFNKQVLMKYVKLFSFEDMNIDESLRIPGEAQKIDRIMVAFAGKFFFDNPSHFSHEDAVYVLAFSIMMLATDLHNPSVKKKMTKEDWVKNNTGINKGQDFDKEFLLDIYDRIAAEPLKLKYNSDEIEEQLGVVNSNSSKDDEEDEQLRQKFKLEKGDLIIRGYPCTFKREGMVYITQKSICFYSKIFGFKEKKVIPFAQVVALTKEKNSELLVRNMKQAFSFDFTNPKDRDEAFSLSKNIWEKINQQQYKLSGSPTNAILNKTVSVLSLQDELPTEDDWNILLKNSKLVKFAAGDIIIEEGAKFQRVYQIVKGSVRVQQSIKALQKHFKLNSSEIGHVREVKSENSEKTPRLSISLPSLESSKGEETKLISSEDSQSDVCAYKGEFLIFEKGDLDVMTKLKSPNLRNFLLSISTDVHSAKKESTTESRALELLGPNDIFGELSFIEAEPSLVSFVADSPEVELYVMEGFVLNRIFEWKPQIALRFFKFIAHVTEKRLKAKQKSLLQGDILTPPATPRTPKGPRVIELDNSEKITKLEIEEL